MIEGCEAGNIASNRLFLLLSNLFELNNELEELVGNHANESATSFKATEHDVPPEDLNRTDQQPQLLIAECEKKDKLDKDIIKETEDDVRNMSEPTMSMEEMDSGREALPDLTKITIWKNSLVESGSRLREQMNQYITEVGKLQQKLTKLK